MLVKIVRLSAAFSILMSVLSLSMILVPEGANATTRYVSWTGTQDFTTIQDAIHAADPGDTIFVYNGTYKEQLTVAKSLNLIGEDLATTRIEVNSSGPGNTTGRAVYVNSDWVNISGFTMIGRPVPPDPSAEIYGVELHDNRECRIENSRFQTFKSGVYLWGSNDNYIANSTMVNNIDGMILLNSERNLIANNTFDSNNVDGVRLLSSNDNVIVANNVTGNGADGIHIFSSSDSQIFRNYAFGNIRHALDDSDNCWDGCYPSGGNYWSDYVGIDVNMGPEQDQPGSDGVGDTPYTISGGTNQDRYPLISPSFLPTAPSRPMNPQTQPGDRHVNLSWEPPIFDGFSTIINYNLYRANTSGEELIAVLVDSLEYQDTGLVNGETYRYSVSANSTEGEGCRSDEVFGTPATVPGPPSWLAAQPFIEEIVLTWSPPSNDGGSPISDYLLYRGITSGGEVLLGAVGLVQTYADTGLLSGQEYFYKVSAVSGIGEGPQSNEANAVPLAPPLNQPPTCIIESPISGTVVFGISQIAGRASDSDGSVEKVEIKIDNGSWIQVIGTSIWTYDWNTTQASDGQHTIYARSFDGENYSEERNVTVNVDNSVPDDDEEPSWPWLLIVVVVLGVMALFVVLYFLVIRFWRTRESGEEHAEPSLDEVGEEEGKEV